jgi:predicted Rossmann fold nucleotide-binding protein DprA/Smf involved in DNA uptake
MSERELKQLANFLIEKSEEFKHINENIVKKAKTKEEILDISQKLVEKLDDMESREKTMTKRIDVINSSIEKLKKEEIDLMILIREKFPDMSNDEIKQEVHSRL